MLSEQNEKVLKTLFNIKLINDDKVSNADNNSKEKEE